MFLFCGAMFLVHATASGVLNRYAAGRKGIVNGLYVAFYYGGGTVGSFLPGFIYRSFGWTAFIFALLVVALFALYIVLGSTRQLESVLFPPSNG
jgi:YNFM family putative membrane transporter